jgi:hypothetical protein
MKDVPISVVELARRVVAAVSRALMFVWNHEGAFLTTLVIADLYLARRTFQDGIWADNDSVCHYAYLRHLIEDVYPATGSFLAYSPKFNLGVPFLLYNTPPGLYVIAAALAALFHLSALNALKLCALLGFVSVPLLGFSIAKTYEDETSRDSSKFVALMLTLYSGELFGLEFFFKNGMLNPAVGVPFLLATVYFFRRAQTDPFPKTLRYIVLGAFFFAATVCTHLLSAYMLCLSLAAFLLGRRVSEWGHDILRLGLLLGLGGGLAAFWLIPSAPFAAAQDAAYTWLRRPSDIVSSFFDGSLFASYFAGFFPNFVTISNVGVVAIVFGTIAILVGVRTWKPGPASALLVFLFGFVITLGPSWSFGIRSLPGYDRLLWYRFLTVTELGWLILAGFGASYLLNLGKRFSPYNRIVLALGLGWALLVVNERSRKIETASDYPEFTSDVDHVATWLREHGDKRGRIFDEFLGNGVIQPPSVNYIRHMMPVLSGFEEIGGWIYENNVAGQILMKKGVFWYSPFPILAQAPRYNVKYILAGSPNFVRALSTDPRWREVYTTPSVVLFENTAYEPVFAEGMGLHGTASSKRYVQGGGYEYVVDLVEAADNDAREPLVVKVGYLPGFTVFADNDPHPLPTSPSADGLLQIDVPKGMNPHRLRIAWDISETRRKGNVLSLAALASAILLVAISFSSRRRLEGFARPLSIAGTVGAAIALVGMVYRGRNVDLSEVGFGVRNGITAYQPADALDVGTYDDDRLTAPIHVLTHAWGVRSTRGRKTSRTLMRSDVPALEVSLAPHGPNALTLKGAPAGAALTLTLERPGGPPACTLEGAMNTPIVVPEQCVAERGLGSLPGVVRDIRIAAASPIVVTNAVVQTSITVVEAESLRNVVDDGGYEAFYGGSSVEARPSNGVVMMTDARLEKPVNLAGRVELPEGRVEVWLLVRTLHPRFLSTRANVSVSIGWHTVGSTRGQPQRVRDFWERDTTFEWVRLGETDVGHTADVEIEMAKVKGAVAGLAEVDALAFVLLKSPSQDSR